MKTTLVFISVLFSLYFNSYGQMRTIIGHVISENLEGLAEVHIQIMDTLLLGETDINGRFKIDIPQKTDKLLFGCEGKEWTSIILLNSCDTVEIIMMNNGIYHHISSRKIDKLRLARFNKLPELYDLAVKEGLFINYKPCYTRTFIPYKPELDAISKRIKETKIQIKKTFKELAIGDTIIIPFNVSWRADGTDRATLYIWSSYTDEKNFDCLIQGIILDKNNHKNGYNLVFEVTNCDKCKYDSIIYDGKDIVIGAVFEHNMKYFKILNE